jgi:hypothetical protein
VGENISVLLLFVCVNARIPETLSHSRFEATTRFCKGTDSPKETLQSGKKRILTNQQK